MPEPAVTPRVDGSAAHVARRPEPWGRVVLIVVACVVGLQTSKSDDRPVFQGLLLLVALIVCLVATTGVGGRVSAHLLARPQVWTRVLILVGALASLPRVFVQLDKSALAGTWIVVLVVLLVVAITAADRRVEAWAAAVFIAGWTLLMGYMVATTSLTIDVQQLMDEGFRSLGAHGTPYGGSIENPYDAEQTKEFLAPEVVEGGRIMIGYPYLPGILLVDLPGYLVGEIRLAHVACLALLAIVLRRLATDAAGRALALLVLVAPLTPDLLAKYWVEPVVMLGLGLIAFALARGSRRGGVAGTALLLLTKQYFIVLSPFLIVVARRLGLRTMLSGMALTATVLAVFFVIDSSGFVRDAVKFQFQQPWREDSVSLMVALGEVFGRPPALVIAVLPLLVGIGVSSWVALRGRPGATTVNLTIGLGFLATVLVSKQSFPNYFSLIQCALVVAAVTWPIDGPMDRTLDGLVDEAEGATQGSAPGTLA